MSDEPKKISAADLLEMARGARNPRSEEPKESGSDAGKGNGQPKAKPGPLSYEVLKANLGANTATGNFFNKVYNKYKFVKNTYDTLETIWTSKALAWLSLGTSFVVRKYYGACKWAFLKYSMDENGEYNKKRGAVAGVALAAFTAVAATHIVPFTLKTSFDAAIIEGFSYEGTSVFSKPNWVSAEENVLNVYACSKYPCQGEVDSKEYRLKDHPWLDLKLLFQGSVHDPAEVAGAFLSEENVCNFTAHGKRVKFPLVDIKYGFWPYITEANCTPVNGDNVEEVLEEMRALRENPAPATP